MLHELSLAIRHASNRHSLVRVPKLVANDQGYSWGKTHEELLSKSGVTVEPMRFEVTAAFGDFVRRVLQSRWLNTDVDVALDDHQKRYREAMFRRCITVISARRRQLTFFQSHQAKLARTGPEEILKKPQPTINPNPQAAQKPSTLQHNLLAPAVRSSASGEPRKTLTITPSETTPSEFNIASFCSPPSTSAPPSTETGSSAGGLGATGPFEVPPAPELASDEKEKMCPYCCFVYPAKTFSANRRSRRWRKHLIEDLQSYICLFENCDQAGKAYRTFKEWQAHLSQRHVQQWVCPLKHKDHDITESEDLVYDTAERFEEHLDLSHSELEPYRLHSVLHAASQRAKLPRWCFVCLAEQSSDVALQQHLAKHLETAFILALPARDDIKDSDAASSGRPSGRTARSDGELSGEAGLSDIRDPYSDNANVKEDGELQSLMAKEFNACLDGIEIARELLESPYQSTCRGALDERGCKRESSC